MKITANSYEILSHHARDAKSYLCVGVQEGECLMHVLRANPGIERIALCDTWGPHHGGTNRGNHDHIAAKLGQIGYSGVITWLDGPSQSLIPTVSERFDLTYVDGDHAEEPALADMMNVWPLTTKTMVVHDTLFPSVRSALLRFSRVYPVSADLFMGGTGTAVVKRTDS